MSVVRKTHGSSDAEQKRETHKREEKSAFMWFSIFFFLFQKTSLRNDGFLWPKFNRLKNRTTFFSYLRFVRGFLLIVSSSHCCCCAENVIMTSMLTLQFFFVLPSNIETKQKNDCSVHLLVADHGNL